MTKNSNLKAMSATRAHKRRAGETIIGPMDGQVPRAAYSIPEFCTAHRISESLYYKLRAHGLGPRELRVLKKVTISVEAAEEWRRARETAAQAANGSS